MAYKLLKQVLPVDIVNNILDYTSKNTVIYHVHKILSVCVIYFTATSKGNFVTIENRVKEMNYTTLYYYYFRNYKLRGIQRIINTVPKFRIDSILYSDIIERKILTVQCQHYDIYSICTNCDLSKCSDDDTIEFVEHSIKYY